MNVVTLDITWNEIRYIGTKCPDIFFWKTLDKSH
jgi:hypothetical protein